MRSHATILGFIALAVFELLLATAVTGAQASVRIQSYPVPDGAHPHDVAPDPAGDIVWYTAQHQGALGRLDPATGQTHHILLGR